MPWVIFQKRFVVERLLFVLDILPCTFSIKKDPFLILALSIFGFFQSKTTKFRLVFSKLTSSSCNFTKPFFSVEEKIARKSNWSAIFYRDLVAMCKRRQRHWDASCEFFYQRYITASFETPPTAYNFHKAS